MDPLEIQVLDRLTFAEEYRNLFQELGIPGNVLADVLRGLIRKKMVYPVREGAGTEMQRRSFIYDTDDLHAYRYMISGKGMKMLYSAKEMNKNT